jgi:hypothetical protein
MPSSWPSVAKRFESLLSRLPRVLLLTGTVLALLVLVFLTIGRNVPYAQSPSISSHPSVSPLPPAFPDARIGNDKETKFIAPSAGLYGGRVDGLFNASSEPRVTYSADLSVVTKDFLHARSAMEEILDRRRGYTAKLRMVGQPSGSALSATLRVPASEYDSALAELKSIGNVERDEESADEIVQQHSELEARLQNAQNAERHLQQLLKDNPVKPGVPTSAEQQLALLRTDIDRMQGERRAFDDRAVFSNIYFSIREERPAPAETFSSQLRSAAASGLFDAFRILSSILLFCVNYGPSLLLWAAILFFPVRLLWRRSQATMARTSA